MNPLLSSVAQAMARPAAQFCTGLFDDGPPAGGLGCSLRGSPWGGLGHQAPLASRSVGEPPRAGPVPVPPAASWPLRASSQLGCFGLTSHTEELALRKRLPCRRLHCAQGLAGRVPRPRPPRGQAPARRVRAAPRALPAGALSSLGTAGGDSSRQGPRAPPGGAAPQHRPSCPKTTRPGKTSLDKRT